MVYLLVVCCHNDKYRRQNMNILKYVAYFVLTLTCMLYLLTLAGAIEVEDEKKVPTYVIDGTEKVLLDDYLAEQKKFKEVVKRRQAPEHFSQDQKQQVEKVSRILGTSYGRDVFRHAQKAGDKYGVDRSLILAVILTESGFDQYAKNGDSHGLMQLSKNTTASKMCTNLYNVQCNIEASTKHLAGLQAKYRQNDRLALAAYNAGGGSVDVALRNTGDIPVSTREYIHKVNKYKQVIKVVSE